MVRRDPVPAYIQCTLIDPLFLNCLIKYGEKVQVTPQWVGPQAVGPGSYRQSRTNQRRLLQAPRMDRS